MTFAKGMLSLSAGIAVYNIFKYNETRLLNLEYRMSELEYRVQIYLKK